MNSASLNGNTTHGVMPPESVSSPLAVVTTDADDTPTGLLVNADFIATVPARTPHADSLTSAPYQQLDWTGTQQAVLTQQTQQTHDLGSELSVESDFCDDLVSVSSHEEALPRAETVFEAVWPTLATELEELISTNVDTNINVKLQTNIQTMPTHQQGLSEVAQILESIECFLQQNLEGEDAELWIEDFERFNQSGCTSPDYETFKTNLLNLFCNTQMATSPLDSDQNTCDDFEDFEDAHSALSSNTLVGLNLPSDLTPASTLTESGVAIASWDDLSDTSSISDGSVNVQACNEWDELILTAERLVTIQLDSEALALEAEIASLRERDATAIAAKKAECSMVNLAQALKTQRDQAVTNEATHALDAERTQKMRTLAWMQSLLSLVDMLSILRSTSAEQKQTMRITKLEQEIQTLIQNRQTTLANMQQPNNAETQHAREAVENMFIEAEALKNNLRATLERVEQTRQAANKAEKENIAAYKELQRQMGMLADSKTRVQASVLAATSHLVDHYNQTFAQAKTAQEAIKSEDKEKMTALYTRHNEAIASSRTHYASAVSASTQAFSADYAQTQERYSRDNAQIDADFERALANAHATVDQTVLLEKAEAHRRLETQAQRYRNDAHNIRKSSVDALNAETHRYGEEMRNIADRRADERASTLSSFAHETTQGHNDAVHAQSAWREQDVAFKQTQRDAVKQYSQQAGELIKNEIDDNFQMAKINLTKN